ncbi:MAG: hypothetical protein ACK5JM_12960 [Rhodoblastus sp.]
MLAPVAVGGPDRSGGKATFSYFFVQALCIEPTLRRAMLRRTTTPATYQYALVLHNFISTIHPVSDCIASCSACMTHGPSEGAFSLINQQAVRVSAIVARNPQHLTGI